MNNKQIGIGLFFIAALVIGLFFFRPKIIDNTSHVSASPPVVPTLFIHGYKGSDRSFFTMITRMADEQRGSKALVCRVSKNGRISFKGSLSEESNNPFIQVIFENNRARLSDQTVWLQKMMKILKDRHNIQEVNLIGHSMGGLALTSYLESARGDTYPQALKLITIGSPFMGIDQEEYFDKNYGEALIDLRSGSAALNTLFQNKASFPADLPVLSIAGVITDPAMGDGLVSMKSALGNRGIVKKESLSEVVINDPAATHFGLHEHVEVDRKIAEFLWGY